MKRFLWYALLLLFSFNSCQGNLNFEDFDLSNDVSVAFPFVNFELTQENFYDFENESEITIVSDTSRFTLFEPALIDKVQELDIFLTIDNEFNREMRIEFIFLDSANNITHEFDPVDLPANTLNIKEEIGLTIAESPEFRETKRYVARVTLGASSQTIDPSVTQFFRLTSYGIVNGRY